CSVVPIGIRTASTPCSIAASTSGQVMRSMKRSVGITCDLLRMSDIVQYSAAMEGRAAVNGVELWYDVQGEGEPVVQIHGAGFGHFNFAPATPALSKHFKVVDYDMRGYGQSDRPVQHYDMEVWADDLAGLMDALDIDQAHVH